MESKTFQLTEAQQEKAIGLRELLTTKERPEGEGAWEAYIDFSRAIGIMLDGLDVVVEPTEIKGAFDAAWRAFVTLWGKERHRLLNEALGGDGVLLDQVRHHRNGEVVVQRILARVREQHGAITTGLDVSTIEITDILAEEMPELGLDA